MASVTYYVALPYVLSDEGELVPREAVECQSANSARMAAVRLSKTHAGAIAFSRSGDPSVGDFEPAKIIDRFGDTPNEVD
ncbi:MAG: hypothetical protein Q8M31_23815 [Beijerinckiaceae bacterium]|nr:hypothetical protein [Beijerinckiaceae bacterium]